MLLTERLKERMNVAGMTQAGLARATSLSQQSINRLVNGGAYSSRYLHQIARALLTSPEYLTGETDDPSPTAPRFRHHPNPNFRW
ncbi:helix-turn-helix transcriptional regulator [Sphingomonas sp. I4]